MNVKPNLARATLSTLRHVMSSNWTETFFSKLDSEAYAYDMYDSSYDLDDSEYTHLV